MNLKELSRKVVAFARKRKSADFEKREQPRLRHQVCEILTFPALGVDLDVDRQVKAAVERGKIRQLTPVTLKNGKELRVGRTKGVSYINWTLHAHPNIKRRERRTLFGDCWQTPPKSIAV